MTAVSDTALTYANGASAAYSYDTASRLLYIDNQTNTGQHKYSYMYDNVGNRTSMMVTNGGPTRTHVYSYDNIYQVTEVNYPAELSYLATDATFYYDDAGNRTSVIDGSGVCSYTSNNLNQYTAAGATSFTYDDSGNMTADGHYTYTYDAENRLTQVEKPDPAPQPLNSLAAYTKGGDAPWVADGSGFAQSGSIYDDQDSWMYIDVEGPGTVAFQWKVSSQLYCDYLEFRVDGVSRGEISGDRDWQQESRTITGSGSHRLQWRYYKDSSDSEGDDRGYVKAVTFTPPALPTPDMLAQAVDSALTFTTGGLGYWQRQTGSPSYYDGDCARSTATSDNDEAWMQTTVTGAGTLTFWWKVSSEDGDYLEFYLDNQLQSGRICGEEDWAQKTYTITGAGTHTLQWRYQKGQYDSEGSDCGWVDEVQWSGPLPEDPSSDDWDRIYELGDNGALTYTYDPSGRRIEKKYDGITVLKYVYDGDSCIAEYDVSGNLRRKYIYGPGIDQPVCMIESTQTYAGTYYYHFDALGSVVALTNSSGNTVEVYDYSVYGQVGASDASHPNRFMFTGREFDKETGLYYYRARYYKPEIGRFLQADLVGYEAGMNLYRYCSNNPWNQLDPFGNDSNLARTVCKGYLTLPMMVTPEGWALYHDVNKNTAGGVPDSDDGSSGSHGGIRIGIRDVLTAALDLACKLFGRCAKVGASKGIELLTVKSNHHYSAYLVFQDQKYSGLVGWYDVGKISFKEVTGGAGWGEPRGRQDDGASGGAYDTQEHAENAAINEGSKHLQKPGSEHCTTIYTPPNMEYAGV